MGRWFWAAVLVGCWLGMGLGAPSPASATPVVVSSDLFHPHDDMDDQFDLVTVHALPELDLLAYILDQGNSGEQTKRPGLIPVQQMDRITGRHTPAAVGLWPSLKSTRDDGRDAPEENQGGVRLLLDTLRRSPQPVDVFILGSCRDVTAAYLREPDLLRRKVKAIYMNVGSGYAAIQDEWNVTLDPYAYVALMNSPLPIYWYPCFGVKGFATLWNVARQGPIADSLDPRLQAFFAYALNRTDPKTLDPMRALTGPQAERDAAYEKFHNAGGRSFWSTASFLVAAGREIYEKGGEYYALTPQQAAARGMTEKKTPYRYEPVKVEFSRVDAPGLGPTVLASYGQRGRVRQTFRVTTDQATYDRIMLSVMRNLYKELSDRLPANRR